MTEMEQHLKDNPWIEEWAKSMAFKITEENKEKVEENKEKVNE